ncbi:hypothetical protein Syun_008631 [Stephania yunnanensis]|uniref:RING-type E3 ubiquitin transferase n=1 Tax=Stephania yunnanensis TaxID=152371 RepID=A0AAP0PNB7_9MAGN
MSTNSAYISKRRRSLRSNPDEFDYLQERSTRIIIGRNVDETDQQVPPRRDQDTGVMDVPQNPARFGWSNSRLRRRQRLQHNPIQETNMSFSDEHRRTVQHMNFLGTNVETDQQVPPHRDQDDPPVLTPPRVLLALGDQDIGITDVPQNPTGFGWSNSRLRRRVQHNPIQETNMSFLGMNVQTDQQVPSRDHNNNARRNQDDPPVLAPRVVQDAPPSDNARRHQDGPSSNSPPHLSYTFIPGNGAADVRQNPSRFGWSNSRVRRRVQPNPIQETNVIPSQEEDTTALQYTNRFRWTNSRVRRVQPNPIPETNMIPSQEDTAAVQHANRFRWTNSRVRVRRNPIQGTDTRFLEEQNRERKSGQSEEEILKHLKTRTVRVSEEGESCSICMDEYVVDKKVGSLSCRHEFHIDCIKDWLLQKNTCPICRRPALKI